MLKQSGFLTGKGGLKLFYREWRPETPPVATVLVIHGAAEHSGRYEEVGAHFASLGMGVIAYDTRGLGQSEGVRGHMDSFDDFLEDSHMVEGVLEERYPGVQRFVFGHSLGGLQALAYGERYPEGLSGVMVTGPCLGVSVPVPPLKAMLGRVLSRIAPKFSMINEIDPKNLARNPAVGEKYAADPLLVTQVTARWFTELMRGISETMASAPKLHVPLLVMQGGMDKLVNPDATKAFFEAVTEADKEFHSYPEAFHELLNEDQRGGVYADIDNWLKPRLTSGEKPGEELGKSGNE